MTHIASRGKEEVPYCFYSISHRPRGGGGGFTAYMSGHTYVPSDRSLFSKKMSPPPFLMITSPPPLFSNYTAPIFLSRFYIFCITWFTAPHFLTTAFTAPIFRHPRNYRPTPHPFFVNYTPAQRSWRGGILDSPCPSVRLSVDDMVSGA